MKKGCACLLLFIFALFSAGCTNTDTADGEADPVEVALNLKTNCFLFGSQYGQVIANAKVLALLEKCESAREALNDAHSIGAKWLPPVVNEKEIAEAERQIKETCP